MKKFTFCFLLILCNYLNAQVNLQNGLVAHYPFNGNANDEIGDNDGTVSGAQLTTDRFGNANSAYEFDGIDDYIDCGDEPEFQFSTDFSISVWVYFLGEPIYASIIAKRNPLPIYNQYFVGFLDDPYHQDIADFLSFFVRRDDSGGVNNDGPINAAQYPLTEGWHHIAVCNQLNGERFMYLNGELIGSANGPQGAVNVEGHPLYIGSVSGDWSLDAVPAPYEGKIDDVRLYNRCINAEEVAALYNPAGQIDSSLVAFYPFCGNADDLSGNGNHGTLNGGITLTEDRFGNPNSAYLFDGSDDFIFVENSPTLNNLTDSFTVSVLFKAEDYHLTDLEWVVLLSKSTPAQGERQLALYYRNTNHIYFNYDTINYQSPTLNEWHHLSVTYAVPTVTFYLDGMNIGNVPATPISSNDSFMDIGRDLPGIPEFFNGVMDEVRIYDRVLAEEEIFALADTNFNCGEILICPTGDITFTSQAQIDAYPFACPFTGNVTISGNDISNLDDFSVVTSIPGDLTIDGNMMLDNTSGLMNIDSIGGHIYITDNDTMTDAPAFDSLDYVGGCIEITGNGAMTDISGFGNLNYVVHYITISGNGSLSSLTGFTELDSLGGDISIQNNVNVINVSGFTNVIFIGGHFYLNDNTNLNNLSGFGSLTTVNNCMEITNNNALGNLQWFTGLTSIGNVNDSDNSYLLISGNGSMTDLTGFENITFIFGSLTIQDNPVLTSLGGLNNTFLGSSSITNISIQNCPELIICQVPCVCDVIMNGGMATIGNNAEGCNSTMDVMDECLALPITLQYLKATNYNQQTLLTWSTATETNNSHFIIEHSIDAQQFTEVGRVAGSGTSLTPQTYSFIHERPHLGVNYYRLRQVDFDGTFEYSDIVNVEFERRGFHIFPNPVESALYLQFDTSQMEIEVNITSITGKVIHSEVVDFSGGPTLITFDIENYPMGVYFLSVNDGKEIQVQRFIKS